MPPFAPFQLADERPPAVRGEGERLLGEALLGSEIPKDPPEGFVDRGTAASAGRGHLETVSRLPAIALQAMAGISAVARRTGRQRHMQRQPAREVPKHLSQGWPAFVSVVFKVAAWLVLIGGGIAIYYVEEHIGHDTSTRTTIEVLSGMAGGTVLLAACLAFFAYVLDLLMEIEWNTFDVAYPESGSDPSPQQANRFGGRARHAR